ncbi:MAG: hypothetical protein LAQ30_02455 [Acidobacteriia bacterium]|nr:hypothetical protein [Terriglobia bacterium]
MASATYLTLFLATANGSTPSSGAGQLLLVARQSGAKITYTRVGKITVNGRDQVRVVPDLSQISPQAQKRLGALKLAQLSSIFRDLATGAFVGRSVGGEVKLLPEQMGSAESAVTAWPKATIAVFAPGQKSSSAVIPADEFLALLSGTDEAEMVCAYAANEGNFRLAPSAADGLDLQAKAMAAAADAYSKSEPARIMQTTVLRSLEAAIGAFESGRGTASDLKQATGVALLSERVYPGDPAQKTLREKLAARRAVLDRSLGVLRALETGERWDAFLVRYKGIERYEQAFPEMLSAYRGALERSRDLHLRDGDMRMSRKDFAGAYREFQLALKCDPASKAAQDGAENARLELLDTLPCPPQPVDPTSARGVLMNRHLGLAKLYLDEGKLQDAEGEVAAAEKIHDAMPGVLLMRARLQKAQGRFVESMATLDRYDRSVCSRNDRAGAEQVRVELIAALRKAREGKVRAIAGLISARQFGTAMSQVEEGLQADPDNIELLYLGGKIAAALRRIGEARDFFNRFLGASDNLAGDPKQRAEVLGVLARLPEKPLPRSGATTSWMSGLAVSDGVLYDPASMVFVGRVARVKGASKMNATYNWKDGLLESVETVMEKQSVVFNRTVRFAYGEAGRSVVRVVQQGSGLPAAAPVQQAPHTSGDVNGLLEGAGLPVLTSNSPEIDPVFLESEMGLKVGLVVAGNRFFHPFVWENLSVFSASYDAAGRLREALPLEPGPGAAGLVFKWDGERLIEVTGYAAQTGGRLDRSRPIYSRRLRYDGGKLVSEDISYGAAKSQIEYKYSGGRLVSASCRQDPSLDNRERRVEF